MGRQETLSPIHKQYITTRYEQIKNITHLAAELNTKFELDYDLDLLRRIIGKFLQREGVKKQNSKLKRLFFDIETSYYLVPTFNFWKVNINPDHILREKKIICICYKWQYEDTVHTMVWDKRQDDTKLIKDFINIIKDADEIIVKKVVKTKKNKSLKNKKKIIDTASKMAKDDLNELIIDNKIKNIMKIYFQKDVF